MPNKEKTHVWKVGDLCKAIYNEIGSGMVYRVTAVYPHRAYGETMTLTPVFSVLSLDVKRKSRNLSSRYCTYLSLVDLGLEYMKLGRFIAEEAKKLSGAQDEQSGQDVSVEVEQETASTKVSSGIVGPVEGWDDGDGGGLCADISGR